VQTLVAVLKSSNFRSLALLRSLGFEPATAEQVEAYGAEADELTMIKTCASFAPPRAVHLR
jgi:hypothetical protein